jgi:hypothetical protein
LTGDLEGLLKKEVSNMKSLFTFLVAALMVLSFLMVGFAYDQSSMRTQQQTMPEKKMDHKEKAMTFTGEIAAVDQTAHSIVVKGMEGEKTFDVSHATMKGGVEPQHYVIVKYRGMNGKMVASSVETLLPKASSNTRQGSVIANSQYAGIGEATRIGLVSECC